MLTAYRKSSHMLQTREAEPSLKLRIGRIHFFLRLLAVVRQARNFAKYIIAYAVPFSAHKPVFRGQLFQFLPFTGTTYTKNNARNISTSPVKMPQTEFLHNNQVLYLHNANTTASYHAICRADSELQKIQSENSVARDMARTIDTSTSPVKMPQTEFLHNNQVLYLHNANTTASYHAICRVDSELQKIQSKNSVARDMARTIDTFSTCSTRYFTDLLNSTALISVFN
ncbi:hypothetical protein T4C_7782 [Trichinella pseudospiralis]|uniref:Uncharacterized protein n=1 Tax=Trichinella pseudospiralis TaxID=6337 RepID=A0A0V1J5J8_TRIPS|nr:hypothetical protein T4C_7782 [Trichinella pseudospiralis]